MYQMYGRGDSMIGLFVRAIQVIWIVICILGAIWIVLNYVHREHETDRLIRDHKKEVKQ
jgi:hypothetical protein